MSATRPELNTRNCRCRTIRRLRTIRSSRRSSRPRSRRRARTPAAEAGREAAESGQPQARRRRRRSRESSAAAKPPRRRPQARRRQAARSRPQPAPQTRRDARARSPRREGQARPRRRQHHASSARSLVDLGFIDEDQLGTILEEMRTTDGQLGRRRRRPRPRHRGPAPPGAWPSSTACSVVNLDEAKPHAGGRHARPGDHGRALQDRCRSSFENDIADRRRWPTRTTCRPSTTCATSSASARSAPSSRRPSRSTTLSPRRTRRARKSRSSTSSRRSKPTDIGSSSTGRETSIDLDDLDGTGQRRPGPQAAQHGAAAGHQGPRQRHPLRAVRGRVQDPHQGDGVLYEMVPPPRHLAIAITTPHQGHGQPRHRRAPPAAGRPHRADRRRQPGRPARQRAADHVRRERRHARARPLGRRPRPRTRSAWTPDMLAKFREVIHKPNGIVLVTGPTGSGKTTTLYSALNELNDIDRQDDHHRRPGRVRHRRHHPGARSTPTSA